MRHDHAQTEALDPSAGDLGVGAVDGRAGRYSPSIRANDVTSPGSNGLTP